MSHGGILQRGDRFKPPASEKPAPQVGAQPVRAATPSPHEKVLHGRAVRGSHELLEWQRHRNATLYERIGRHENHPPTSTSRKPSTRRRRSRKKKSFNFERKRRGFPFTELQPKHRCMYTSVVMRTIPRERRAADLDSGTNRRADTIATKHANTKMRGARNHEHQSVVGSQKPAPGFTRAHTTPNRNRRMVR